MGQGDQWCEVHHILPYIEHQVYIDEQDVEHMNEFVFLSSSVPSSSAVVKCRIVLGSAAFGS